MARFYLTRRAQNDLQDIKAHTQKEWGGEQAKAYLLQIRDACQRLADNPKLGKTAEAVAKGLMHYPVGSHMVFYKLHRRRFYVVCVLHQRMLPTRHISANDMPG